jgi:hypothetical protein
MEIPTRPAGLGPVVAEIIEALARTMIADDNSKAAPAGRVQGRLPLWKIWKDEGL